METWVLALMALVLGVGALASAAFPLADDAPRGLMTAFGASALAMAVAITLAGPRFPHALLHVSVLLLVAMRSVMVAAAVTERGLMLAALGFVWTAVYVAFFFRPAMARLHAALMTGALGVALIYASAPTDLSVWLTLTAMIWVAVTILAHLNSGLRAQAHSDGLTGLLNRSGFALEAPRHRAMAARRGEAVAVAAIDLDDFKAVNDRAGHAAGDRLLAELTSAWRASLRPGDLLARFGGDEFILMFPVSAEEQVDTVLARLRRAHPAPWTAGTAVSDAEEDLDGILDRADSRLYEAKSGARFSADPHRDRLERRLGSQLAPR